MRTVSHPFGGCAPPRGEGSGGTGIDSIREALTGRRRAAGILCAVLLLSARRTPAEDALVVQGEASASPAVAAALAEFEERVRSAHAREVARATREGVAAEPPAGEQPASPPAPGPKPPVDRTPRVGLRSVLDRMAASIRWQVTQDSWSAGVRLRYSRSVEYDPETVSFALVEAIELTPAAAYRVVALGRPMRIFVRRTGYPEWSRALFAAPSRWLFFNRPDRIEEAQRIEPGTEVVLSNEARFFVGPQWSGDAGQFPVGAHAGFFASGEYFVRLKRLPASLVEPPGDRDWMLAVGGTMSHGFESSLRVRTPEIVWGKRLRVLDTDWRLPRGIKFRLRAGPVDLRENPTVQEFFRAAVGGAAVFRFSDFQLLGKQAQLAFSDRRIGPGLLADLERFSRFEHARAAVRADDGGIPFHESVSRFKPRAHGSFGIGLWALVYGLSFGSDWYSEESFVMAPDEPPISIVDFPLQRRWDRGWILFPRETQDIQMVTALDARGSEAITELSLEIEDAHARRGEGRSYRDQIRRFLGPTVASRFPVHGGGAAASGAISIPNELPDLDAPVGEAQRVSIYLRLILGPRYHAEPIGGTDGAAAPPDSGGPGKKKPVSREERITRWQREITRTIRGQGDSVERLVREHGTEDLFVSYRIALTPYARRKEKPAPTIEYVGSLGDPDRVPSYRRLRRALDAAGATY